MIIIDPGKSNLQYQMSTHVDLSLLPVSDLASDHPLILHSNQGAGDDEIEVTTCGLEKRRFEMDFDDHANVNAVSVTQSSTSHSSEALIFKDVGKIDSPKQIQTRGREGRIVLPAGANDVHVLHQMCIRTIGKRLYIDGYIYYRSPRGRGWICKRNRKTGCRGKVFISDPSKGKELTPDRVDDWSSHDHPPDELEVEEAELKAKLELNRLKFEDLQDVQNPRGSKDSNSQNTLNDNDYLCPKTKSAVVSGSRSNRQPKQAARKLSTSRKRWRQTKMSRLHYKREYREFLIALSMKTTFDRLNILRALKVVYSSYQSCLMAYATVLENREKIKRDLEALKKDPNTDITALEGGNLINLLDANGEEDTDQKKHLPLHQELIDETARETVVPVDPVTVHARDLLKPALPTSSNDEPEIKQEIEFIDLTDDSVDLPTIKHEFATVENINPPPGHIEEAMDILESSSPPGQNAESGMQQNIKDGHDNFHENFMREMRAYMFDPPSQITMPCLWSAFLNQLMNYQPSLNPENPYLNASCSGEGIQTPSNLDEPNTRDDETLVSEQTRAASTLSRVPVSLPKQW